MSIHANELASPGLLGVEHNYKDWGDSSERTRSSRIVSIQVNGFASSGLDERERDYKKGCFD